MQPLHARRSRTSQPRHAMRNYLGLSGCAVLRCDARANPSTLQVEASLHGRMPTKND